MNDYEYLKKATDEQLERWAKERKDEIKELHKQIDRIWIGVKAHQVEIDRRELAANPDAKQLKAGDKLLTTPMAIECGGTNDPLGSVVSVEDVYFTEGRFGERLIYVMVHFDNSLGSAGKPLEVALDMRRAYLQQQEDKQP